MDYNKMHHVRLGHNPKTATLVPGVPRDAKGNLLLEGVGTPRVSFSPTIEECIVGVIHKINEALSIKGSEVPESFEPIPFTVYESDLSIVRKLTDLYWGYDVLDQAWTREVWSLDEIDAVGSNYVLTSFKYEPCIGLYSDSAISYRDWAYNTSVALGYQSMADEIFDLELSHMSKDAPLIAKKYGGDELFSKFHSELDNHGKWYEFLIPVDIKFEPRL